MSDRCPQCNQKFQRVAQHWTASADCEWPDTPGEVVQTLCGVLSVGARFDERGNRKNIIRMYSPNPDSLEPMRDFLGVYANTISCSTSHSDWNDIGESTTCQLPTKPIPEIQSVPDFSVHSPDQYFFKGALFLKGSVQTIRGNEYYNLTVANDRFRGRETFEEYFGQHKTDKSRGRIQYQIPVERVEPILNMGWPSGWWNGEF